MQPELKEQLEAAARESGRSLNSELISRLEQSFVTSNNIITESFLSRIEFDIADKATELANAKLLAAELACGIAIAISAIPKEIASTPKVANTIRDLEESIAAAHEFSGDDPSAAANKAHERWLSANEKLKDTAARLEARRKNPTTSSK